MMRALQCDLGSILTQREGFSPGSSVFLSSQNLTLPNSNLISNLRATGLSVARLLSPSKTRKHVARNICCGHMVSPCFSFFASRVTASNVSSRKLCFCSTAEAYSRMAKLENLGETCARSRLRAFFFFFLIVPRKRSEINRSRESHQLSRGQLSRGLFFFAPLSTDYKKKKKRDCS